MSVTVDIQPSGLCVITLDEPARRNPVGHAVRTALVAALSDAEANTAVRAVVLTGAGGHFSAGGDIRDQAERSLPQHRERFALIKDMVLRLAHFSKPLVAAVDGWAAGGGFALALACPTIVAAKDARFMASFTKIGLIPDMGLLATLPARIGAARSRRLLLSNRVVDASYALNLGLVDELADVGDVLRMASEIALQEAEGASMPRQFIIDWFARDITAALDFEQSIQPMLINSADAAEGRAAFSEKRPPQFRGC